MSIQKVLEMAEKFVTLAEEPGGTAIKTPHNLEYQAERNRLIEFYDHFTRQLRIIINEMGSNLGTLKAREFDHKMFKMLGSAYQSLIDIYKEAKENKPYIAAEKLVRYTLERPNNIVLDNLDFLAKHHMQNTNVDFKPSKALRHPEFHSIDDLKRLALELKKYMAENPLITAPGQSTLPPPRLVENVQPVPDFRAGQEEKTNAALPFSKKKE
jgi:hypothetical protein